MSECGCKIVNLRMEEKNGEIVGMTAITPYIVPCPKHALVDEMVELLKEIVDDAPRIHRKTTIKALLDKIE